jgi:hypothetical protein
MTHESELLYLVISILIMLIVTLMVANFGKRRS